MQAGRGRANGHAAMQERPGGETVWTRPWPPLGLEAIHASQWPAMHALHPPTNQNPRLSAASLPSSSLGPSLLEACCCEKTLFYFRLHHHTHQCSLTRVLVATPWPCASPRCATPCASPSPVPAPHNVAGHVCRMCAFSSPMTPRSGSWQSTVTSSSQRPVKRVSVTSMS